jgi:hypothetical protein
VGSRNRRVAFARRREGAVSLGHALELAAAGGVVFCAGFALGFMWCAMKFIGGPK